MKMSSDDDFDSSSDVNDVYFDVDVDDDELGSSVWQSEASTDPVFNSGLARLFARTLEADLTPEHLRSVLAQIYWQPTEHPGESLQKSALEKGRAFGGKKPKKPSGLSVSRVACFVVQEAPLPGTPLAHERLNALRTKRTADAVLLQYQDKWYGFVFEQFIALEELLSQHALQRDTEAKETWRLAMLTGEGELSEFLSMPVYCRPDLPTDYGITGKSMGSSPSKVIRLYTAGFNKNYFDDSCSIPLREVLTRLAARNDYDGIQFNTKFSPSECQHTLGPNFARAVLSGRDMRRPPRCPAEPLHQFEYAHYLTRWFSDLRGYSRKEVEAALDGARFMLSAIPPGADALPREAVQSLLGAFYLRCKPEYATRKWLERFIRRCERALAARWRVGVF